jgi:hypothetical protein
MTWREPARRLPLRWGTYEGRYLAGLIFVIGGLIVLVGSNTYVVPFLLVGTVVHAAGWFIFPAPGARRIAVVFPSLMTEWLLLIGPQVVAAMVIPFLAWLIVRERPLRSYVTAFVVVGSGILLANNLHTAHDEPVAFGIQSLVVIGCAWLARALATTRRSVEFPSLAR